MSRHHDQTVNAALKSPHNSFLLPSFQACHEGKELNGVTAAIQRKAILTILLSTTTATNLKAAAAATTAVCTLEFTHTNN